jgi:lysophospholipase L1-like esterase
MVEWRQNPLFNSLLSGPRGERWDAILLSAGGNDLIDAASVLPRDLSGKHIPPERRLLLQKEEWNSAPQAARYISDDGWQLFSLHLEAQYQALIEFRDAPHSSNQSVPVLVHLYDYPTPRYSPAASFPLHFGPWLAPAMHACGIPQADWIAVSHMLIDKLAALTLSLAKRYPYLHVVDTRGLLNPATPGSIGKNGHWINEIHPNREGYRMLAEKIAAAVTAIIEPGADSPTLMQDAKMIPFSLRRFQSPGSVTGGAIAAG